METPKEILPFSFGKQDRCEVIILLKYRSRLRVHTMGSMAKDQTVTMLIEALIFNSLF
jgi:hypothetical protein